MSFCNLTIKLYFCWRNGKTRHQCIFNQDVNNAGENEEHLPINIQYHLDGYAKATVEVNRYFLVEHFDLVTICKHLMSPANLHNYRQKSVSVKRKSHVLVICFAAMECTMMATLRIKMPFVRFSMMQSGGYTPGR